MGVTPALTSARCDSGTRPGGSRPPLGPALPKTRLASPRARPFSRRIWRRCHTPRIRRPGGESRCRNLRTLGGGDHGAVPGRVGPALTIGNDGGGAALTVNIYSDNSAPDLPGERPREQETERQAAAPAQKSIRHSPNLVPPGLRSSAAPPPCWQRTRRRRREGSPNTRSSASSWPVAAELDGVAPAPPRRPQGVSRTPARSSRPRRGRRTGRWRETACSAATLDLDRAELTRPLIPRVPPRVSATVRCPPTSSLPYPPRRMTAMDNNKQFPVGRARG